MRLRALPLIVLSIALAACSSGDDPVSSDSSSPGAPRSATYAGSDALGRTLIVTFSSPRALLQIDDGQPQVLANTTFEESTSALVAAENQDLASGFAYTGTRNGAMITGAYDVDGSGEHPLDLVVTTVSAPFEAVLGSWSYDALLNISCGTDPPVDEDLLDCSGVYRIRLTGNQLAAVNDCSQDCIPDGDLSGGNWNGTTVTLPLEFGPVPLDQCTLTRVTVQAELTFSGTTASGRVVDVSYECDDTLQCFGVCETLASQCSLVLDLQASRCGGTAPACSCS